MKLFGILRIIFERQGPGKGPFLFLLSFCTSVEAHMVSQQNETACQSLHISFHKELYSYVLKIFVNDHSNIKDKLQYFNKILRSVFSFSKQMITDAFADWCLNFVVTVLGDKTWLKQCSNPITLGLDSRQTIQVLGYHCKKIAVSGNLQTLSKSTQFRMHEEEFQCF